MKHILTLCLFTLVVFSIEAQVETKYYAYPQHSSTISKAKEIVRNSGVYRMPTFDVNELLEEDSIFDGMVDCPYRFGKDFPLSVTLDDGDWHQLDNGRVWTMSFESVGALSLNFIFDNFFLPEGATLEIINEEGSTFYGPVRANAIPRSGHFMTDLIPGEKATIYLYEPKEKIGKSTLTISSVIHAYRGFDLKRTNNKSGDSSSSCNVDVACESDYEDEAKAVAVVLLANGTSCCSGSLVLSSDMSFKPYFLTAFHCLDTNSDGFLSSNEISSAENWMFKFNFKREECSDTTLSVSTTYNGAIFRAACYNTDFALMEIDQDLKSNTSLFWLGWDRSGNTPTYGACIHHPHGDIMKIAIDDDTFVSDGWDGGNLLTHWRVTYDEGVTEQGSSGSPILDQNHRVVGQLTGGDTIPLSCVGQKDWFGKFNISWTGEGTNDTRLNNWLDPIGSGLTTIDGSFPVTNISGPVIPCGVSVYSIPNLPTAYTVAWSWKTSSNTIPITQNSPSTNQCTITNNNHAYIKNTLIATIKRNGISLKTLEKDIDTGASFSGTYSQNLLIGDEQITIPTTAFTSGATLSVYYGGIISLSSSAFSGANVSYSGLTPSSWWQNGNKIYLSYQGRQNGMNENAPAERIVQTTITGTYNNSCNTFQFYIVPLSYIPNPLLFSVSMTGSSCTLSLASSLNSSDNSLDFGNLPESWTLIVTNSLSGRTVLLQEVRGTSITIDTSTWDTGIYVVQAKVGTEVLTQKISVTR